jgi:hypothetical protein
MSSQVFLRAKIPGSSNNSAGTAMHMFGDNDRQSLIFGGAIVLAAIVLAGGLILSAFLASGRYVTRTTGSSLYVIDRFTGDVRECSVGDCEHLSDRAVLPAPNRR